MLKPVNRMLLVGLTGPGEKKEQESTFYLPDDVATKNEYEIVREYIWNNRVGIK